MAQNKKFDLVFFIVMALAIMLLVYLSVNITNRVKSFDEIVKLSGTIILPIPLALFAMYITAGRKRKLDYSDKKRSDHSGGIIYCRGRDYPFVYSTNREIHACLF